MGWWQGECVLFRVDDDQFAVFLGHVPKTDIALGNNERVSCLEREFLAIVQGQDETTFEDVYELIERKPFDADLAGAGLDHRDVDLAVVEIVGEAWALQLFVIGIRIVISIR